MSVTEKVEEQQESMEFLLSEGAGYPPAVPGSHLVGFLGRLKWNYWVHFTALWDA